MPPEPILDDPDLVIEIPDPEEPEIEDMPDIDSILAEINAAEPIDDWVPFLKRQEYPAQDVEITGQSLRGVRARTLDHVGFIELGPAPDDDPILAQVMEEAPNPPTVWSCGNS